MDGTVADTRDDIAASVNWVLAGEGRSPLPVAEVWRCVGEGIAMLMRRVFGDREEEMLNDRVARFRAHYSDHLLDSTRLYPGVADFFARVRVAILTNKPEDMSRRIVAGLGLDSRVEAVVGGDSLSTRKPHPAGIDAIVEKLNAARAAVVMVGDSVVDLETARAGGVGFIGVSYGYSGREGLVLAGAERVVDSLAEIAV